MADAAAPNTPAAFLKSIKGRTVVVRLNSGVDYRGASLACVGAVFPRCNLTPPRSGTLACLDGFMNIAMEQTEARLERSQ